MTAASNDSARPSAGGPVGQPVATPAPLANTGLQAPTAAPSSGSAATKDSPSPAVHSSRPERRRRGPGARGLSELSRLVSDRDVSVLELVTTHRFLTTRHIEHFLFHDHASSLAGARACRRVLARLERWGLLQRPLRRIGGLSAGSASSVWLASSRGLRLLSVRAGLGAVGRVREPGERFVQHYLAIADTRLDLVAAERAEQLELLTVQIEPECWRPYSGLGGSRGVLKPDLFAITAPMGQDGAQADYVDHWFIEVDRGTESLPTLLRQCRLYETYRRTGSEQQARGVFPLVVWVVPDVVRAAKLHAALQAAHGLDKDLFRITTADGLVALVTGGTA
jgi:hypothetical protein